ncbi:MAG: hypothetical protein AAGF93_11735 [Cyanobacteria bacterium P01_H01_bin.105]
MLSQTTTVPVLKLSLLLTVYMGLSFALFLGISNTLLGGIVYLFWLLPLYGALLLGVWILALRHRQKLARIKIWLWLVIGILQIATLLTSPGNCYGVKQGDRCYSNLQIVASDVSRAGPNDVAHWQLVEDAFPGLAIAYGLSLAAGISTITYVEKLSLPKQR